MLIVTCIFLKDEDDKDCLELSKTPEPAVLAMPSSFNDMCISPGF